MCRRRIPQKHAVPRQEGPWFENRVGSRVTTSRSLDYLDAPHYSYHSPQARQGWNHIHVPSHWASQHELDVQQRSFAKAQTKRRHCASDGSSGHDYLSELPAELLIDILKIVVPSGRTFHFSPIARRNGRGVSVHQVCSTEDSPKLDALPRVALVCRRMQLIAYDLFYGAEGRNHFVLEMSNVPLVTSIIVKARPNTDGGVDRTGSWSRVHHASPVNDESLFPLSSTTLRCMADLTLAICMSSLPTYQSLGRRRPSKRNKAHKAAFSQISQGLEAFAACFSKEKHSLRSLALTLSTTRRDGGRYTSMDLRLRKTENSASPARLEFNDRIVFEDNSVNGSGRGNYCGGIFHEPPEHVLLGRNVVMDEILAPLLKIRGVREVKVGGLMGERFTKEFERVAVQPFEDTPKAARRDEEEDLICEPPKKRARRS